MREDMEHQNYSSSKNKEANRRRAAIIKKKKRKRKIQIIITSLVLVIMIIAIVCIFLFSGPKSVNRGADKVEENDCIAFYPKESGVHGENFAKELCNSGNKDVIYDYTKTEFGEFIIYDYGNSKGFMTDAKGSAVVIDKLPDSFKVVLSDYLRYTMKKDGYTQAYTSEFLEETYYKNLNVNSFTYSFDTESLICSFPEYKVDVSIPYQYLPDIFNYDLGVKKEDYVKPTYVDASRPMVALTFDDGPDINKGNTEKILEELSKYDGVGTFFTVGTRLSEKSIPILRYGIERGCQYGSHSVNHPDLSSLESSEITTEVMSVSDFFKENLGYTMNIYRPPYGIYDGNVDAAVPLAAVLWDVDSQDWMYKNGPDTVSTVQNYVFDGAVILLHDIHDFSASAVCEDGLTKWLVDEGYQLVDVNTVANKRGIELSQGVHFCWD